MMNKFSVLSCFYTMLMLLMTCLLPTSLEAQPDVNGELLIYLMDGPNNHSQDPLWIYVDAQGVVWGKSAEGYPITYDYDNLSDYATSLLIDHVEDIGAAPDYVIGFGLYKITIAGNSIYVDYRDCDYPDSYSNSDIWLYYNVNNGIFYEDANLSQPYDQDTVAIWEDGRKSSGIPTHTCFLIPVTVQNNFTGGQITVDGNTYSSPYSPDWSLNSSHSISAISPQNVGSGNYVWCAWSDAGAQTHNVSVSGTSSPLNFTAKFVGTYITGPGYLTKGQRGTYDCNPTCASGNCSYRWYKKYDGSEYWYSLGTAQTQQITMYSTAFTVKVDVTDDDYDKTATATTYVTNEFFDARAADGSDSAAFSTVLHNYPNPFNPQTTIGYQLLEDAHVTLKVYDLRGQEVATVVDEWQAAGKHKISFDASKLTSGVYWYQLQTGKVFARRKMVLLR